MFNPLKYFRNRTVGLALGSGGARGLAHISVIEYLKSMKIPIDMIAGSSMGAVVGALHCIGSLSDFKNDILNTSIREMLSMADPVLPRSGLLGGNDFIKFLKRYIPEDSKIENLKVPLCILATDYDTGRTVLFKSGSIIEALRASASIPGIFVPVSFKGTLLVDGGVSNPLPINIVKSMGAGMTVAVNLHPRIKERRLRNYVRTAMDRNVITVDSREIEIFENKTADGIPPERSSQSWYKSIESLLKPGPNKRGEMPSIFEVISQSIDIMEYVNTMLLLKYNSPTVLIEPNVMDIGTMDFNEAEEIITEGYSACSRVRKKLIGKIKMWI